GRRSITWHPESKWFAVWGAAPDVQLCNVASATATSVLGVGSLARESSDLQFSPDGKYLARASLGAKPPHHDASSGKLPKFRVVDLLNLQSLEVRPLEGDQELSALRFSADGRTLFGAGRAGSILAWHVPSGEPR